MQTLSETHYFFSLLKIQVSRNTGLSWSPSTVVSPVWSQCALDATSCIKELLLESEVRILTSKFEFIKQRIICISGMAGITLWWVSLLLKKLKIDDPLDAFAVHYGGGVVGVLATPVFMSGGVVDSILCKDQKAEYEAKGYTGDCADSGFDGCFSCDHFEYKVWAWNLCGLVAITAWAGGLSLLMFQILNLTGLLRYVKSFCLNFHTHNEKQKNNWYLRVEKDIEIRGLDIKKHGEPAYPTAAYGHGWDKEGDYATNGSK